MTTSSIQHDWIRQQIDAVSPGAFAQLERLETLPDEMSRKIAAIALGFACQAQNELGIRAGRDAFKRIPKNWAIDHLYATVASALDVTDEWEYRRLLELLKIEGLREQLDHYIRLGLESSNAEIVESAQDFV